MSGSGHLMESPNLMSLNLTWGLHGVLSLDIEWDGKYNEEGLGDEQMEKFGCDLHLKKSLSYLT